MWTDIENEIETAANNKFGRAHKKPTDQWISDEVDKK